MQDDIAALGQAGKLLLEFVPLPALCFHSGVDGVLIPHACHEQVQKPVIVLRDGGYAGFDLGTAAILVHVLFDAALDVAFGVDLDLVGTGKLLRQAADNQFLHVSEIESLRVWAGSAIGVGGTAKARPARLVHARHGHARAAGTTLQQAGEKPFGPIVASDRSALCRLRTSGDLRLYGVEKLIRDDAQLGSIGGLPFALGIWAGDTLAGARVFHHLHLAPHDATHIDGIAQHAGATGCEAV
ncbi:hypothetical protein [Mesorhizobium sp. KR1-2]|uniref:hypothetical protein n=1 Tax=Mesorhizobium sp. KR1-2 TaxID=3156609 RepID=UPI0032B3E330